MTPVTHLPRLVPLLVACAVALLLADPAHATTTLAISPSAPSVVIESSQAFVAEGGSGAGYAWSVESNPSGGTIDAIGVYRAGSIGGVADVVRVTDSTGNTAVAQVNVMSGLVITPSPASVVPGKSVAFVASGGSGVYEWSFASDASGGTLTAFGLYTAGDHGGATDVVRVVDSSGNATTVQISVAGGPVISPSSLTVLVRSTIGFVASGGSGAGYTWSLAANGSGATISELGDYRAGPLGGSDVIQVADSAGQRSTTSVTVDSGLVISPPAPIVLQGTSVGFVATGGSGRGYTWSLARNESGATLSELGVYAAGFPDASIPVADTVRVIDSEGNSQTAPVTVTLSTGAEAGVVEGASGEGASPQASGCATAGEQRLSASVVALYCWALMAVMRRRTKNHGEDISR